MKAIIWQGIRNLVVLLLLVAAATTLGDQAPQGLRASQIEEFDRVVAAEMARQRIPALSMAVAVDGELRWANGYGMSDVENFVPAKASTVYHLGGIRHYNSQAELNSTRHYQNGLDPLLIFQSDPLLAEPGTKYSYTTYGYVLLGAVVEIVVGKPFIEYLQDNIFEPAGMDRMQADDVYAIIPNRARGYRISPSGQMENCALADTSNKIPGGGLSSTVEDVVKFALALRKGVVLKATTMEQMFTHQTFPNGESTHSGLGWFIVEMDGVKRVGHSGGQQGVSTNLAMFPRRGDVVAVMCNLERAEIGPLTDKIFSIIRQ